MPLLIYKDSIVFGFFSKKGPFTAKITPCDETLDVAAGDNLLKAALDKGLAWPHNCRVGSCGQCRCRLVSGKIKALNDFSYVLTKEELDAGMILACQTSLRSDVQVEVSMDQRPTQPSPPKCVVGIINSSRPLTHDILEIQVQLAEPLPHFLAGQYAELSVPGVIDKPRSYSFASAPRNGTLDSVTFFIRHVPGGELTTWLHGVDRVGEKVLVNGPFGSFWLRESSAPMLCVAGGSGMAPIKALLEQVSGEGFKRKVTYIFGARTHDDLYCLEEMEQIKACGNGHFDFIPVLSREPDDSAWGGLRGHCTEFLLPGSFDLPNADAYLCGPPPMVDSAIECLRKAGVSEERIFYDRFLDASHINGRPG